MIMGPSRAGATAEGASTAELVRIARMTGLFYLGMAIAGVLGFLVIRPRLFAADDPSATLAHLVGNESLARAGVVMEMLMVLAQALTAIWFYRLFRAVDAFAAGGIAAFGLVNAVLGLSSAAFLATAVEVAFGPVGDAPATVYLMYLMSGNLWGVGALRPTALVCPSHRATPARHNRVHSSRCQMRMYDHGPIRS